MVITQSVIITKCDQTFISIHKDEEHIKDPDNSEFTKEIIAICSSKASLWK